MIFNCVQQINGINYCNAHNYINYMNHFSFNFRSCYSGKGVCDYPSAHVPLTNNQQLLMIGQKYRIVVSMELPESPVNEEIG